MIGLAGGLSIIFGTNLGATSGIWLLAFAGQSLSLNAFVLPMLVFGVLMGFLDKRLKPFGQAIIGISLVFLGVDTIKDGFSSANDISFSKINVQGFAEVLIFVVVGFLLTCVLQSSHATLILTLSALRKALPSAQTWALVRPQHWSGCLAATETDKDWR